MKSKYFYVYQSYYKELPLNFKDIKSMRVSPASKNVEGFLILDVDKRIVWVRRKIRRWVYN